MKNHPLSFEIENNTTINRRMKFRSKVWAHFLMNRNDGKAKCVHCSKVLKAKGGSTKSLHHHLIFKLSTVVPKLNKNILDRKMTSVHEGEKSKHSTVVPKLDNFNVTKVNEPKSTFNDDWTTLPFTNGISLSVPKW